MAIVRFVTSGSPNTKSYKAFEDEFVNILGNHPKPVVYSATGGTTLDGAAHDAVRDAVAGDVIVTAGSDATAKVLREAYDQSKTTNAIVQALGGQIPDNPNNLPLTGFYIDTTSVAMAHARDLVAKFSRSMTVTILCDYTGNQVSRDAYDAAAPFFDSPTKLDKTADDLKGLGAKSVTTQGFIVIPNGGYFENITHVTKLVDGNTVAAYYPERDYKEAHQNKTGVKVLGHRVSITFRLAAYAVDNILNGYWNINSLPPIDEAMQETF
jgi:hypothetical protein